jgi:hypothetical protein
MLVGLEARDRDRERRMRCFGKEVCGRGAIKPHSLDPVAMVWIDVVALLLPRSVVCGSLPDEQASFFCRGITADVWRSERRSCVGREPMAFSELLCYCVNVMHVNGLRAVVPRKRRH